MAINTPNKTKAPRKFSTENAFDDVGHQRRLRGVVLDDTVTVRRGRDNSVYSRIDQIRGHTLIVDEVSPSSANVCIRLMADYVAGAGMLFTFGLTADSVRILSDRNGGPQEA